MDNQNFLKLRKQLDFNPSEIQLISHLSVDLVLGSLIYFTQSGPFYILSQLLLPIFMFRMFALMHDCLHGAATKNTFLGNTIGTLCGACCLLPYEPWKKIHLAHHRWSGNVDKDPSMGLVRTFNPNRTTFNKIQTFFWKIWFPFAAISQHIVFWSKSYQFVIQSKNKSEKIKNTISIIVPALIYSQVNWFNNILGLFLYLLMVEVINFPHHLQMPMTRENKRLNPKEQYLTTRSCSYPSWFSHHILNNFNLHTEHHLFPVLPWYRLESIQHDLKEVLKENYTEIKNNSWIIKNRKKSIDQIYAPNYQPTEARKSA